MFDIPDDPDLDQDVPSSLLKVPGDIFADLLEGAKEEGVAGRDFGSRYDYLDILGEGGQGVVVRARDKLLERDVAIKALKSRHDTQREEMLLREAMLCGKLEHPNILPTYDLVHDEADSPLFVMKKIEGHSLEDLLRQLRSEPDGLRRSRLRLLNIFLQVLNAVDFAHSRGILHLDLKPANISLGEFGEVYVIDWGFAREKSDAGVALAGGTVHYMAPERMSRDPFDERADIYSLGAMLYRLLTGTYPRDTGDMDYREYKKNHQAYPLIPPRERDRSIPRELEAIVLKAMQDDQKLRYGSAHEFTTDLVRFMDMLPVSAYKEGIAGRLRRYMRKHRRRVVSGSIVALMIVVSSLALWGRHIAQQRSDDAEAKAMQMRLAAAEEERLQKLRTRRRYEARRILDRATDLLNKSREAVEAQPLPEKKKDILTPSLELFDQVIKKDKDYAQAYEERAQARKLIYDFNGALADYEEAFRRDPSFIMSLYEAGLLLADALKKPEEAREKFRQMQQYFPDDEYALLGQARVDMLQAEHYLRLSPEDKDYSRRNELAETLFRKVMQRCDEVETLNPVLSDIWYLRGLVYQKSPEVSDPKKALEAYNNYLVFRRDSPSAYHNRGDAHKDLDDIDGAIADYTEALKINPEFIWSLRNRGYLYYRYKNNFDQALADINLATKLAPDNYWGYVDRGAVYDGMGEHQKALADYKKALSLHSDDSRILYRLGICSLYMLDVAQAEGFFTRALHTPQGKGDYLSLLRRGASRLAQNKYADAVSDFEETIRTNKDQQIYPALLRFIALKLEGIPVDRNEFGKQIQAPDGKLWLTALGSFYLGEAVETDVLKLYADPFGGTDGDREFYRGGDEQRKILQQAKDLNALCQARCYLGLFAYSQGQMSVARRHLQAAVDSGRHLLMEYSLAKIFLNKLD